MAHHVIAWPAPAGETASPDYTMTVDGTPVFVYQARVRAEILQHAGLWTHLVDPAGERASFAIFDQTAPVTITIHPTRHFSSAKILPIGAGITPEIVDGAIRITLPQPRHLTLTLDDSDVRPLHLFISAPERDIPSPHDPHVVYFGPGIHELDTLRVRNGQTVYLAGGAVVRAKLAPDAKGEYSEQWKVTFHNGAVFDLSDTSNVRICGRGILDAALVPHPGYTMLNITRAHNIVVEGIVLRDAANWNVIINHSYDVRVNNLRLISGRLNSDGINSVNSQRVQIRNCFVRNHDDSIAVKTTEPGLAAEDIDVEGCTIWNDWGYALGVTYETRAPIHRVRYHNCAIIFGRHWYLGVHVSDSALISDIAFTGIEIDELAHATRSMGAYAALAGAPQLLHMNITEDCWGHDHERGHIAQITLDGLAIYAPSFPASEINGFDPEHAIRNVVIRDVRWNGRPAPAGLKISHNAAVYGLQLE